MDRLTHCVVVAGLATLAATANAGDRRAVLEALDSFEGNWPAARLVAEVVGLSVDEAVLGSRIQYVFSASEPGVSTVVHVSSHGEMTLLRGPGVPSASGTIGEFVVEPPLGRETTYLLLSSAPLDALFGAGQDDLSLGDDGPAASRFVAQLDSLTGDARIAVAKVNYEVVARPGETEYTTKGIRRVLDEAREPGITGGSGAPVGGVGGGSGPIIADGQAKIPSRVNFEFDSAQLTQTGKLDLDVFGEVLLQLDQRGNRIVLAGHTDDSGDPSYNQGLSLRRASAVQDYLTRSFGIDPSRLEVKAYGLSQPLVPNDSEANRARNRRVEFIFSVQQ